jgi:hypothetical protein
MTLLMIMLWARAPLSPSATLSNVFDVPWLRQELLIGVSLVAVLMSLFWFHQKISKLYSMRIKMARDGINHDAPEMQALIRKIQYYHRLMVLMDYISLAASMLHLLYLSQRLNWIGIGGPTVAYTTTTATPS